MKVTRTVVKTYHCEVCDTGYHKPKSAQDCGLMPVEAPVAKIGDRVRIIERRECLTPKKEGNSFYFAEGVVAEISEPQPYDEEYEVKWLRGSGEKVHRRSYLVRYKCPHCGEERGLPVFAPEFVIVHPRSKTAQ